MSGRAFEGLRAVAISAPRRASRAIRHGARHLERRLPADLGVLAYHRVAQPAHDPWALSVTPRHFDEQLTVLRELGRVERLDVALDTSPLTRCLRRRPIFALTFDDGYVDNLRNAVPILEKHDAPATIFIATGMLDEPSFWWDVLSDLIFGSAMASGRFIEAASRLDLLTGEQAHMCGDDLDAVHGELYALMIRLPPADIAPILGELSAQLGLASPTPSGRPVTTDELLDLASHPLITVGIHTVNHVRLTLLSPGQARAEVVDAARRLGQLIADQPRVLAYPYGAASPAIAEVARSAGITHAVTTDSRWVGLRENPMLIPRLHPHDLGREPFREWLRVA
jgi:peptidoglycan/xylan/chitin deacetylase (PgdA/CDA1 family)